MFNTLTLDHRHQLGHHRDEYNGNSRWVGSGHSRYIGFVDISWKFVLLHILTDLVSFSTISAGITAVLTLSTISLQSRTELPKVPTSIILQHIGNILAILARTIFWKYSCNILYVANNILEYSCKQYFGPGAICNGP